MNWPWIDEIEAHEMARKARTIGYADLMGIPYDPTHDDSIGELISVLRKVEVTLEKIRHAANVGTEDGLCREEAEEIEDLARAAQDIIEDGDDKSQTAEKPNQGA